MDLVIIGAGGFGREVLDIVTALEAEPNAGAQDPFRFVGFVDDGAPDPVRLARLEAEHLGGMNQLSSMSGVAFVVGVGAPGPRAMLAARAEQAGWRPVSLVHPSATLGADVEIAPGTVICAGVRLTTNVRVGRHVHLNLNVTVGHDTVIEDFVTVNPLAAISGDVILRRGVMVGTNACVNQGIEVGQNAVVGSGAAVVRNAEPGVTVVGVPARPLAR